MVTNNQVSLQERQVKRSPMSHLLYLALSLLLLLSIAPASFAQTSTSATLRGTVKDPAGAVVPNATVTLISERTRAERRATTSGEGTYAFASVDPGPYTLRVEATNFKIAEQTGLTLAPSDIRGVDVTLEVGAASETVTVTAESNATLQTETGEKSNTITAKQIENLSIIGRSSMELLRILPGVVAPEQSELESTGFGAGANNTGGYNVNGLRGTNNNVSIDGSRVIDIGSNSGTIVTANIDMVQEVKVQTSNFAAEYGNSGVQISAVTKGGGQDFHGTVYDYLRPHQLAANDRSNTISGVPRPKSNFKYPGGNIGGPVYLPRFGEGGKPYWSGRDKLFFFYALEFQRQIVDPGTIRAVVPTLKQRQGDFSEFLTLGGNRLNQGRTVNIPGGYPGAGTAAPNNDLTPYIDPIGKALINLYPLPNLNDPSGTYNYASTALAPLNRVDQKMRLDYNVSDTTKAYLRLARETEQQDFAYGLWWNSSNYELPSHVQGSNLGRSAALNITTVLNASTTNEVVFSASKLKLDNDYRDPGRVTRSALGIENFKLPFGTQTPYAPLQIISAWNGNCATCQPGDLFTAQGYPIFAHNSSYSVTDNFTKIRGTHSIKFGGLLEQANKIQNFDQPTDGQVVLATWGNGSTGNEFADLLTGRPATIAHGTRTPNGHWRFYNIEGYAQDSWKVRPNITLEYGLRVSYLPNNKELQGLGIIFDPRKYDRTQGAYINADPKRPNGLLLASRGEIPKGLVKDPPPQFAPRLNMAWDIGGKGDLVLRGGVGLFYNRVQGNAQYYPLRLPPNAYTVTGDVCTTYPAGQCPSSPYANDPRQGLYTRFGNVDPFKLVGGFEITTQDPFTEAIIPRNASMSLSLAKRLPFQNILEVAYVGTLARHLQQRRNTNYLSPLLRGQLGNADLSNPIHRAAVFGGNRGALNNFLPFPTLSAVNFIEYTGTSNYHSLQATLNRQLGRNLQYFATYTFSKALGLTGINENAVDVDPVNARGRSYGILPYDRTHIFNLSYNYNVPDIARGSFRNWFTSSLLNGWQMSGITTYSSGRPMYIGFGGQITSGSVRGAYFGTDASGGRVGGIAPVYLRNPTLKGQQVNERVLDINALTFPAFGESGAYQPPFYVRSPRRTNFDVSFFKNFKIDEARSIQFRSGFFNIFNQAYPNPSLGDINTSLDTTCNATLPAGIPTGNGVTAAGNTICDPTKGFSFTEQTRNNFGKITNKHGRRIVELAVKFYF